MKFVGAWFKLGLNLFKLGLQPINLGKNCYLREFSHHSLQYRHSELAFRTYFFDLRSLFLNQQGNDLVLFRSRWSLSHWYNTSPPASDTF